MKIRTWHASWKQCRLVCGALVLQLIAVYYMYNDLKPHVTSFKMLVRNRYYNQAFQLSPRLTMDLNNVSLLLYWTPFFQNPVFNGHGAKPFADCPVNACVATNDRRYLRRARAVLFHCADLSRWDVPAERAPHQLFVYMAHEAPPMLDNPLGELNVAFNLTMTYRRDSDVFFPYFETARRRRPAAVPALRLAAAVSPTDVSAARAEINVAQSGASVASAEPTIAWVVSHCRTPGRREDYVDELRRYVAVDEYGACSGRECAGRSALACYQHLARTHTFYLAFENSLCADYITEKFFFALRAGLVPVVRGATRAAYAAVAPPGSFVHVDDVAGPRQLAQHLRRLARNASALARLTSWRSDYVVDESRGWCRLCARMRQADTAHESRYDDLRKWWNDGSHCHVS